MPAHFAGGLDYMHARYYSPHLGRFMSVDPVMESADPFLPQTWNRYTYVSSNPLKYLDPRGEILFFFGASSELQQVKDLANENLHGVDLVIDKNGKASLVPNNEAGPPSPQQKAFADNLSFAINVPESKSVDIQVVSNDSGVIFGQYITSTIDVQDIAAVGPGPGVNSAALFAHEVMEQTTAQIAGLPFNRGGHQVAHPSGIRAQERVSGYRRLAELQLSDHDGRNRGCP